MSARISRRTRLAVAERIVEHLPAFAGHAGRLLDRMTEAVELAADVLEGRLNLAPQGATTICEKEVSGDAADDRAGRCRHQSSRLLRHARLQSWSGNQCSSCMPR